MDRPRDFETKSSASTSVVRAVWPFDRSGSAQIFSGRFAGPAVCDDVKADILPLIEGAHAGAFNRADMNKDVIATIGRLNEAKALLAVKPLHNSLIHGDILSLTTYTRDQGA